MCSPAHGQSPDEVGFTSRVSDHRNEGPAADPTLIEELVVANRILFREGVVDGFGHVSVRHDKRPDHFLLARNMAPALVTADDIVEFDLDGNPMNAQGRAVYLERFIHGEIFRARPDVVAVVHSHSHAVVPFGIVRGVPFRPVCHMSSFLPMCTPIFEIRDVCGEENDLLITNGKIGAALAECLGDATCVLMRGHGSTVVGSTLREAVFRAVYTEVNAHLQSEAMRIGPVTYLSEGEHRVATRTIATQINRAWDFWRMRAEGKI